LLLNKLFWFILTLFGEKKLGMDIYDKAADNVICNGKAMLISVI